MFMFNWIDSINSDFYAVTDKVQKWWQGNAGGETKTLSRNQNLDDNYDDSFNQKQAKTENYLTQSTHEKQVNEPTWNNHAKQLGKGALLLAFGALAYFGFSALFGKKNPRVLSSDGFANGNENKLKLYNKAQNLPTLSDAQLFDKSLIDESLIDWADERSKNQLNDFGRTLLSITEVEEKRDEEHFDYRSISLSLNGYHPGDEFQVNVYTMNDQIQPSVSSLKDGKFVVIWATDGFDGSTWSISGRIFNTLGQSITSEFLVNSFTTLGQSQPSVTWLFGGGFVVVWTSASQEGGGWGNYGQCYNATGYKVHNEFHVNTYTTGDQQWPVVSGLSNGGFIVVWSSFGQDGNNWGIIGQCFDADCNKVGGEFQINSYTLSDQFYPVVSSLSGGGIVVVWQSYAQDSSDNGIYSQLYSVTVSKVGSEFQVNSHVSNDQSLPVVCGLNDGGFIVIWNSNGQEYGGSYGIFGQRFDVIGNKVGDEFQINTYMTSDQTNPSVSSLPTGGFVVVWQSNGQDGSGSSIYGQRYDANGNKVGIEFQVNTYTTSDQTNPSVSSLPTGGFVVVWTSNGQDGSGYGIYGRLSTPRLVNNKLEITSGAIVSINSDVLITRSMWAQDNRINFTINNIRHGHFEKFITPRLVAVSTFTQEDVIEDKIRFVHDGSNKAPYYEIKIRDGDVETPYFPANIIFHTVNDYTSVYILVGSGMLVGGVCYIGICSIAITGVGLYLLKAKKRKSQNIELANFDDLTVNKFQELVSEEWKEWLIPYENIKLGKKITAGGFSLIYKAKWENNDVIYKICKLDTAEEIQRFMREVKIMFTAKHPNIIQAFGVCVETNRTGILMEYMSMGSLSALLHNSKNRLAWYTRWFISYDIASGLAFLHKHDVVHRDLKSDNILIYKKEEKLRAKITDFGLSKQQIENDKTATGQNIGTYQYMPPELFTDAKPVYSDKSDIYGVGIIFWEIAARKKPFAKVKNVMTIPIRVSQGQLKLPELKDCPPSFAALMKRCCTLRTLERPTAQEIVNCLEKNKEEIVKFSK